MMQIIFDILLQPRKYRNKLLWEQHIHCVMGSKSKEGLLLLDNVEGDFMEEEAYEMDFNKKKVLE